MLRKLLLLFTLLITLYSFAQSNISNINKDEKIELLSKKVDSIIAQQNEIKTKVLEDRIAQATETIANQNSTISSFSYIYSSISLILGLIGITLPFLTYLFGIKPSQDALKEFEEKSDAKFNSFLKERTKNEIDNAIVNLKSDDNHIRNNSLNFLTYSSHQGLMEDQILKIINVIRSSTDEIFLSQLLNCIINEKNEELKKYFIEFLNTSQKSSTIIFYCLKFFSYYSYGAYKQDLKIYISNNNNDAALATILGYFPKSSVMNFLNDSDIIDIISNEVLNYIHSGTFGENYISLWNISKEEYENTYLYIKLRDTFSVTN